jgi:hypothetical protein
MTMKPGSVGIFRGYLINPPRFGWIPVKYRVSILWRKPNSCNNFQVQRINGMLLRRRFEWNNAYT